MKIGIDARFYGPLGKGLGRYTQEIVDRVIKIVSEDKDLKNLSFVIFLSPDNYDLFKLSDNSRVEKIKINFRWYSLAEQLLFPIIIKKNKIDLMHFPHFNIPIFCPSKFVVTIHDLILTHFPSLRATTRNKAIYWFKNLAYKLVINKAVSKSEKIITVSRFTKNDILSKFKVSDEKIVVSYEGVANFSETDSNYNLSDQDSVDESLTDILSKKYILYVGSAYPHKNLEVLLDVFSRLKKEGDDIILLLVGKKDYFYKRLEERARAKGLYYKESNDANICFAGYVPDSFLHNLYKNALAFIFPSLYEGFGLPPLEAMSVSCPVLSSNKASLPEISGQAALYFDPENVSEIYDRIKDVEIDSELRNNLIQKGTERVKMFSWHDCAEKTVGVYKLVLKS